MRNTLLASALAIATLGFPAFAQQPATGGTVVTSEPGKASIARAAEVTARVVGIDEVVALAVYLASDAAKSITGAMLTIDGGWTAQ